MLGNCRLCNRERALERSHILPKSVYKLLKDVTNNGDLRLGNKPNLPVQDGYKDYLLCGDCEDLFQKWEAPFASRILRPLAHNQIQKISYESWFLKFCVSISWRVLMIYREKHDFSHLSPAQLNSLDLAMRTWKDFLFSHKSHPGQYEQHFLPMGVIKDFSNPSIKLPPNINSYIHMTADMDITIFENEIYVYSKLGPLFLLGRISTQTKRKEWIGTKVNVKQGVINSKPYKLPSFVFANILYRAEALLDAQGLMSEAQIKKVNSLSFNAAASFAMQQDSLLFKRRACPD